MSLPRQVSPGRCYMITRRCSERRFFMRPDSETNNAFLYCLTVAAQRTEVGVMFFLAMSNHYHAGIIDKRGRLPEFLEYFHKLFAKHQNALRGRWENFWATEQTSAVELVDGEDVIGKMMYTLTNPVKDGLVQRSSQWPGASSLGAQLHGNRLTAHRPRHLFRPDGPMPEAVALELTVPPGAETIPREEFAKLVEERLSAEEARFQADRLRDGVDVLGCTAVLQQHWSDSPDSVEPRRRLSPRVACRNGWRRAETLRRNSGFVDAYRAARDLLLSGIEAVFPEGTYWLRRFAGAACVLNDATT
jgi:putative transposase